MTVTEAEDSYKLGHGTVAKAAKAGRLESRKSGAVILVLRADVERLWRKS
ncbi:helix-turn-helix domain-containing protein [Candidatus Parcubacteria bacterium]|nr:helix-turn-helix domain-containing protein [Candidatus Parcubacteria bacterium]